MKRFVINEHDRALSAKRGGGHPHLALDFENAERIYALERRHDDTPEHVFDRKWATITIDRALRLLRNECDLAGKQAEANALMPYLTDDGELPPYKMVATELGLTEGAVKVAVHRLRQRFGSILRAEVSETVTEPDDVEDEMRELIRAVGR